MLPLTLTIYHRFDDQIIRPELGRGSGMHTNPGRDLYSPKRPSLNAAPSPGARLRRSTPLGRRKSPHLGEPFESAIRSLPHVEVLSGIVYSLGLVTDADQSRQ